MAFAAAPVSTGDGGCGETFVVGADPAEGNPQSDNSPASVVDLAGEQVGAWAGRFEPAVLAAQIVAVSAFLNGAAALVERNNHGHAVLLWLREFSTVQALPGLDKKKNRGGRQPAPAGRLPMVQLHQPSRVRSVQSELPRDCSCLY